jgi:hypothetical protein
MTKYDELKDYLSDNGFDEWDYGDEGSPCIYWHHDLCSDILFLRKNVIEVFSFPIVDGTSITEINSKADVDQLILDLNEAVIKRRGQKIDIALTFTNPNLGEPYKN